MKFQLSVGAVSRRRTKTFLVTFLTAAISWTAYPQGTVEFTNVHAGSPNAPVYQSDGIVVASCHMDKGLEDQTGGWLNRAKARSLRIEQPGARYHTSARGNERKNIFRDQPGHFHFLELLSQLSQRDGARVHAYLLRQLAAQQNKLSA